jgi:hypothetical protein
MFIVLGKCTWWIHVWCTNLEKSQMQEILNYNFWGALGEISFTLLVSNKVLFDEGTFFSPPYY